MLNNMPINDEKEDKKRKIMFIIIGVVCFISIVLAILYQIIQLKTPPVIKEEKEIVEFKTIFNNELNEQGYPIKALEKFNEDKKIVYTLDERKEKSDGKYDIDVKIPIININNHEITNIDKEIEDTFKEKIDNIMASEEEYEIIYTVEYTAYINENILSLAIKSTLKEGIKAQRVIIKTYTYNMTTNEVIDIDEMMSIKKLNKATVQGEINRVVSENAKQAQSLIDLGYKVYERNLSDEMYKIENLSNFFYGPDGALYIIYAYGNNSYTSELDIVPII
ncbi:MAG: hypothetical protein HFJ18_03450 [Clostridia bacterium]|nr:hypothetical protein [Clostridia bacterium]